MSEISQYTESLHEECGVFGLFSPETALPQIPTVCAEGKCQLPRYADHVFFQGVDKVKTVAHLTSEFFLFHLIINVTQLSGVLQMPVFTFGMAVKEQFQFSRIHGNISVFDTIFHILCHYHIFFFLL